MSRPAFQSPGIPTSTSDSGSRSPQADVGFGGDAYPLPSQQTHPFISGGDQLRAEQCRPRTAGISIRRKPIGHSSGSASTFHHKVLYQHVSGDRFELVRTWWAEALCCLLFMGAFVAIVLTIQPYEGQPLPQWPYRLSINSLISVYVVILKAAMLLVAAEGLSQLKWRWFGHDRPLKDLLNYDRASRGPWGCLNLLYTLRGRQFVSSCGAFITVAALIIDPFAQQVIATYDCNMATAVKAATIPRTNYFDEVGPHIAAGINSVRLGMQHAINAGVFDPGRSAAFDCPTGNCTFPSNYHTTGYCSQCSDVTSKLFVKPKESNSRGSSAPTWTITLAADDASSSNNISTIMSNGPSEERTDYLTMRSALSGNTDVIINKMDAKQSDLCVDTCVSDECNTNPTGLKWGCADLEGSFTFGAASCSLFPCVRTYTAAVNAGQWEEKLVSVPKEFDTASGTQTSMVDVECLDAEARSFLTDAGYALEGRSWILYNLTVDPTTLQHYTLDGKGNTQVVESKVSADCVYQNRAIAANSIEYFLSSFLNGTISHGSYPWDFTGPAHLQAIYNEGNDTTFDRINQTWSNISESMTTYIREHGNANLSRPATGQTFTTQTCVHIQWPFLIYPAVLVLLAIVFFVCMVFQTGRQETSRHDWKSSTLALLFHGLDRGTVSREELVASSGAKEMEQIAEHMPVRLIQTETGWQLVRSQ